jgi:hypothetical protein
MITQEFLQANYVYSDGNLYTRMDNRKVGCLDIYCGYYKMGIKKKTYRLHRLIYLYHHGVLPKIVDHINGDITDNRIENLQGADDSINNLKKITKPRYSPIEPGRVMNRFVNYKKDHKKYCIDYHVNGHKIMAGYYDDLDTANKKAQEILEKRIEYYDSLNYNINIPEVI